MSNFLADILGATSSKYQLKRPTSSSPTPLLDPSPAPQVDSYLPHADVPPPLVNFSSGKRFLDDKGSEDAESPPKKRETESERLINETNAGGTTIPGPIVTNIITDVSADTHTVIVQFNATSGCGVFLRSIYINLIIKTLKILQNLIFY